MNRKLYTRMLQILFAVLLSLATACDEDNGGGNEDPKPSKFSVTLSVKDVSLRQPRLKPPRMTIPSTTSAMP
mgnify:CR=1 FL=1